ncbi:cysteine protease ATG4C isoform X1 [Xiphophorus couchianus]|uniref:cysteine protease ATG4C isoform X1 n=1 Tax=Xiphophorus couchianus TaxID=32473 RepID=UPI00101675C5|nr:cysteine protease ATG4C isoform X1 [Xiphophorus couchianus]
MANKGSDEVEKLKTKFMSMWHNVKYSWALKSKTPFSRNSPAFLLGKCYHFKAEDDDCPSEDWHEFSENLVMGNVEAFRKDFASRLWLTYREDFPPLPGSTLTSDCGWGCMLRVGQMMMAQALVLHVLGRDWSWPEALTLQPLDVETRTTTAAKRLVASLQGNPRISESRQSLAPQAQASGSAEEADAHLKEMDHRNLVSWFADVSSAPLGLHSLVRLGMMIGKQAGDWYGPAMVAHILKEAVKEAMEPGLASITVYVSQDCTVYNEDVMDCHKALKAGETSGEAADSPPVAQKSQPTPTLPENQAVVILIPVRLGGERTNPEYFDFAKRLLRLEYCIGIIGGKLKEACYFVGFQGQCQHNGKWRKIHSRRDDSLIYMDPHYCQSFVNVSTSDFPLQSYHCPSPKKMPFSKMDPSCTIGFYSRSAQDYERIREEVSKLLEPSMKEKYPLFTFLQGRSADYDLSAGLSTEKREWPFIRESRRTVTTAGDFVLL